MVPKYKSSDVNNLNMPKRSRKLLPWFNKKVFAKVAKIYDKNEYSTLKL